MDSEAIKATNRRQEREIQYLKAELERERKLRLLFLDFSRPYLATLSLCIILRFVQRCTLSF